MRFTLIKWNVIFWLLISPADAQQQTIGIPTTFSSAFISGGGHPTLTSGSCSGSSAAGGLFAGTFVGASCVAGTYILSALPTAPTGWACDAVDRTTTSDTLTETASGTTSATLTGTTAASDVVQFKCIAY